MEEAGKWALGVCGCGVVAVIVDMLASHTRLEKNVRFVLGTLMLCVVILPLGNVVSEVSASLSGWQEPVPEDIPETVSRSRTQYLEKVLAGLIRDTLVEKGIEPSEVRVKMDIDDGGSISMITAALSIRRSDAGRAADAAALIKEELGISCKTIIAE